MKENSIEETKRIIEKLISAMKTDRELFTEKKDKEIYTFFINALEHILSDYKKVLKENEELKDFKKQVTEIESTNFIKYKNYISKQKVKDKIEEINKKILNATKYDEKISVYRYQKQILQELIEESE